VRVSARGAAVGGILPELAVSAILREIQRPRFLNPPFELSCRMDRP
jgi:hypothetical protein